MSDGSAEIYIAEQQSRDYYSKMMEEQAHVIVSCDSILLEQNGQFTYYATERIDLYEKNKLMLYSVCTKGKIVLNGIKNSNSQYDFLIGEWKVLEPELRAEHRKPTNKDKEFSLAEKELIYSLREMIKERQLLK